MRDIVIPLVKPSLISTGIIFFINSWNEYVWPVLILKTKENYTLSLALQMYISSEGGTEFTIAMAVSVHDHAHPATAVHRVPALYHQYLCHVRHQGLTGKWRIL